MPINGLSHNFTPFTNRRLGRRKRFTKPIPDGVGVLRGAGKMFRIHALMGDGCNRGWMPGFDKEKGVGGFRQNRARGAKGRRTLS